MGTRHMFSFTLLGSSVSKNVEIFHLKNDEDAFEVFLKDLFHMIGDYTVRSRDSLILTIFSSMEPVSNIWARLEFARADGVGTAILDSDTTFPFKARFLELLDVLRKGTYEDMLLQEPKDPFEDFPGSDNFRGLLFERKNYAHNGNCCLWKFYIEPKTIREYLRVSLGIPFAQLSHTTS